jgi:hypothetical protein
MVVQLAILTYPTMIFLLLTRSTGPMECSTGNSYQAEALTNVLRYQIYTVRLSIRPLIGVNNVKPMSGGSLK